jgi:ribosome-associated protein
MTTFSITDEYIELCRLLKALGWCDTGGQAKAEIAEGNVFVNGTVETRKRYKTRPGDAVSFAGSTATVVAEPVSKSSETLE